MRGHGILGCYFVAVLMMPIHMSCQSPSLPDSLQSSNTTVTTMRPGRPSVSLYSPGSSPGYLATIILQIDGLRVSGGKVKLIGDPYCADTAQSLEVDTPAGYTGARLTLTIRSPGVYPFAAKVFDSSLNAWSDCSTVNAVYTLLAPVPPSALSLYSPSSSPGYTSIIQLRADGTIPGHTVNIYSDSSCTNGVASASVTSSTTWITLPALSLGSYTFYARSVNEAVTVSPCSTASVSYTYAAPPVPSSLALVSPASSPGTNARPTIRIGGLGSGLSVNLYSDSSCTTKLASSSTYGASLDLYSSYWSSSLTFGSYTFYANTNAGTTYSACSTANVSYTLQPLSAPTSLALVTPASSPSYFQTPVVPVAGVSSGQTAYVYTDSNCATQVGSASASGTSVNVTVNSLLPVGANTLYAKVTDSSYGQSLCSTSSLPYTVSPLSDFATYQRYDTGYMPQRIAKADFNGDGKMDIVTANYQYGLAGLFLGNGDGTFQSGNISPGNYTAGVAVADFNRDGKADLVFANYGSSYISVMLGKGNGTFQNPVSITTSASSWTTDVATGDFNGDGNPDIAVIHFWTDNLVILLGRGDGSFQSPVSYPLGGSGNSIIVADFNNDGIGDIAVSKDYNGGVTIYFGNGDGTFSGKTDYLSGINSYNITAGDINGDGKLDLVVAAGTGFNVLLNNGSGTFAAPITQTALVGSLRSVSVADIDGDGKTDVVASDYANSRIQIYYGAGNGNFSLPEAFPVDSNPVFTLIYDFTGNGKPDIVAGTYYLVSSTVHGSISVLKR
jgi:hypothetical protein